MEKEIIINTQISEIANKEKTINRKPKNINTEEKIETIDFLEPNSQNVLQGIIWSEILGKPKSLRKGR